METRVVKPMHNCSIHRLGSVTSQESNHPPHDSHFEFLTTTLKTGVVNKGRNDV